MSAEDDFLNARLTKTEALIVVYENAVEALATGQIESYELDTGQSKQIVKRHNLTMLNRAIDSLYNRRATLRARLGLDGATLVKPSW